MEEPRSNGSTDTECGLMSGGRSFDSVSSFLAEGIAIVDGGGLLYSMFDSARSTSRLRLTALPPSLTVLINGTEGCLEVVDVERLGDIGEKSSFFTTLLGRLERA